jgi:hypothetical protein
MLYCSTDLHQEWCNLEKQFLFRILRIRSLQLHSLKWTERHMFLYGINSTKRWFWYYLSVPLEAAPNSLCPSDFKCHFDLWFGPLGSLSRWMANNWGIHHSKYNLDLLSLMMKTRNHIAPSGSTNNSTYPRILLPWLNDLNSDFLHFMISRWNGSKSTF